MYDWANSGFQSTVITAVFPPFFASVAAAGLPPAVTTARFAWATTIAVAITAVIGPVLGAVADYRAMKKRLLAIFMGVGVAATMLMVTISRGEVVWSDGEFRAQPGRGQFLRCDHPPAAEAVPQAGD